MCRGLHCCPRSRAAGRLRGTTDRQGRTGYQSLSDHMVSRGGNGDSGGEGHEMTERKSGWAGRQGVTDAGQLLTRHPAMTHRHTLTQRHDTATVIHCDLQSEISTQTAGGDADRQSVETPRGSRWRRRAAAGGDAARQATLGRDILYSSGGWLQPPTQQAATTASGPQGGRGYYLHLLYRFTACINKPPREYQQTSF